MVSRKLAIRDEPNMRLRPLPPVCPFNPVPAPRAHVFQHVRVVPAHTTHHTAPQNTHNTTTQQHNITHHERKDRERERKEKTKEKKTRQEKMKGKMKEKMKENGNSASWQVNSFSISAQIYAVIVLNFIFVMKFFCLCSYNSLKKSRII